MAETIQSVPLDRLTGHPDNPNRQSKSTFIKLVRNIGQTGKYEPLVVRPHPQRSGHFQIINGHHRYKALEKLGYKQADVVIWDIDDRQADILLATLNRLCGSDVLDKKITLLKRLSERLAASELSKLLPQTRSQIERLINLKLPSLPAQISCMNFPKPMVFFVSDLQQQIIEKALSAAGGDCNEKTEAAKRSESLVRIAQHFIAYKVCET